MHSPGRPLDHFLHCCICTGGSTALPASADGPECYAFVFEVHFGLDLLNRFELSPGAYSSIGVGFMRNVGSEFGVGALVDYQFSRPISSYGYKVRGRWRQIEDGEELGGVDVEAGFLRSRKWPMTASNAKPLVREDERGWGATTGVRANFADRLLLFVRHDVTWMQPLAPAPQPLPLEPLGPARVRHALFVGGGGGSEIGLGLTLPWLFLRVDAACHRGVYC